MTLNVMNMLEQEYLKGNGLIYGVDSGNTSTKVSVLNQEGDIESYSFPSVIAKAPDKVQDLYKYESNDIPAIQKLHVKITSQSVSNTPVSFYVGEYAKDKSGKEEPKVDQPQKANTRLHIITTLTAIAVAAWSTNKEGRINAPFSGGLPIKEITDEASSKYLNDYKGEHTIEAIDGPFAGKKVTLVIESGIVNVEGVTSELALSYNIKKGAAINLSLSKRIGNHFAVVDGGAGTLEIGLFGKNGFNAHLSENYDLGTNPYIDKLMHDIETKVFTTKYEQVQKRAQDYKSRGVEVPRPYNTREQFMREVIIPGVEAMIEHKDDLTYTPTFKAKWGRDEDTEKVTELVLDTMTKYANDVLNKVTDFELKNSTDVFVFVGGGLLFGLYKYRELDPKNFIFPAEINKADAITSNAYLIRSYTQIISKLKERKTVDA